NFALRFGFLLILQFGMGHILASIISSASKSQHLSSLLSVGLLSILVTSWLTFFNISEILYSVKIIEVTEHFGMLFFVVTAATLQGYQIVIKEWPYNDDNYRIQRDGGELKLTFLGMLFFIQLMLFIVYWIN